MYSDHAVVVIQLKSKIAKFVDQQICFHCLLILIPNFLGILNL